MSVKLELTQPLSMTRLFRVCLDVLVDAQQPLHYRTITDLALERLGYTASKEAYRRVIEDVREKMLEKGRFDTFYLGEPWCVGGLHSWLQQHQMMMNFDRIVIPGNAASGIEGAFEVLMRPMVQKNPYADPERRNMAMARGKVIETHMQHWFKARYPAFYREPNNHRQWHRWSEYDFGLEVNGRLWRVDVFGPNADNSYGNKSGKRKTDLHLGCEARGDCIAWHSVLKGSEYEGVVIPEYARTPIRMIVWLNCWKNDIDYSAVARAYHQKYELITYLEGAA